MSTPSPPPRGASPRASFGRPRDRPRPNRAGIQQAQSGASYIALAPNSQEVEAQQDSKIENGHIAAARIKAYLQKLDGTSLELQSVYGSAIALPQLARCAGYNIYLTQHAIRAYLFMIINCVLQFMLVYALAKEEIVMAKFSGRMNLCDFAIRDHGQGTVLGPGGTDITAPRLYAFDTWVTRTYARDALLALFPDKREEIHKNVDPGEYGAEWAPVRIVCAFLFIMAVVKDVYEIYEMGRFFAITPSQNENWLHYKAPMPKSEETQDEDAEEEDPMEGVTIKVAGMSNLWKAFYVVTVLLPKAMLWKGTTQLGVTFLMETEGISDVIVNSMALAFVLNIDELAYVTFSAPEAKFLMENLVQYSPPPAPAEPWHPCLENLIWFLKLVFPRRLCLTLMLSAIFLFSYYWEHCEWSPDGIFVSKDMFLPRGTNLNPIAAFFPTFALPRHDSEPYWTMQHEP